MKQKGVNSTADRTPVEFPSASHSLLWALSYGSGLKESGVLVDSLRF